SHFHVQGAAGIDEAAEVVERAELRVYRVVTALPAADGIRTARVVRFSLQRVVAALAIGPADRMNRRQIDHVEAKACDLRQSRDAIVERAVAAGHLALAPRHHL